MPLRKAMQTGQYIAALDADQNEARDDQVATVTLVNDSDQILHESAPQTILWTPTGPGYPLIGMVDQDLANWPLSGHGRYEVWVAVNGTPVGRAVPFIVLAADGSLRLTPRPGVRRRGYQVEFAHFSGPVDTESFISFQDIEEFRTVAQPGTHLLRGWFSGELSAGSADSNYVRTHVEIRRRDGTPVYTSPEDTMRLTNMGPGQLKGAFFIMKLPLIELVAPEDYTFVVLAEGKDAGSMDFPILLAPMDDAPAR